MKSKQRTFEEIKNDRIVALEAIKNAIINNNQDVIQNIDELLNDYQLDEQNVKHYRAVKKAEEMITDLTISVCNATTSDDITKARKQLNYYLDKVKKEIVSRQMPTERFEEYYQNMRGLKSDISELVRAKKREDKLKDISSLVKETSLTTEEMQNLQKNLTNERRFNRRIINKYQNNSYEDRKKHKPVVTATTNDNGTISINDVSQESIGFPLTPTEVANISTINSEAAKSTIKNTTFDWQSEIQRLYPQYQLVKTKQYDGGLFKNVVNFFSNIPIYIHNKGIVKEMRFHYNHYYRGEALEKLIDLTEYDNSIKNAVAKILSKCHLFKNGFKNLQKHEEYMETIRQNVQNREKVLSRVA